MPLVWFMLTACPAPDTETSVDDGDGDGFSVAQGDCDDEAPAINPLATDVVGDGIDQNCDDVDGTDADGDGVPSEASGGDDCDDTLTAVNPAQTDIAGDAVDQNCDGTDGTDGDGDGFASVESGGEDCDDSLTAVSPAQVDLVGDALDQNCDGIDGTDTDGDGVASAGTGGTDCDDLAALVYPGAEDTVGDAVDQSCDGVDGIDVDLDGFASTASGGPDCDDSTPLVSPVVADSVGDALDQNCDGIDGMDTDLDGFASIASGGDDCADGDPALTPADADLDGVSSCDGDCDDADAARFPANPEVCNAVDDDCDALVDFAGAVDACAREEALRVGSGALDVLFVVDDSISMATEQAELADGVDEFLTELVGFTDLHVGVVTTDMSNAAKSGRLQPGPDGALFIDDSYDLTSAIAWLVDTAQPGLLGDSFERPRDASYAALETLADTDNVGFARTEADMALVVVTDEGDASTLISHNDWKSWFSAYRAKVSVHAFAAPAVSCGAEWISHSASLLDLVTTFGGLSVPVCDTDWGPDLADMALDMLPGVLFEGVFSLAEVPDPVSLSVEAEEPSAGAVLLVSGSDYVYDAALNAVVFTGYTPPIDTTLTVSYRVVP